MSKNMKIQWVLAHVPYDLFLRSANAFARTISEKSNGTIEIEVMGKNEWEEKYNDGKEISNATFSKLVNSGVIGMTQTYSTVMGRLSKEWFVLDMPFLFRDHDHAARVLDGEVGEYLKADLASKTNMQPLAFTYSGGYKMLALNKRAESIEDVKGLTLRCASNPISEAYIRAIGAEPQALGVDGFADAVSAGAVEGGENVFPRYFRSNVDKVTSTVANTEHSLFLTTILVSKNIWNSLTEEQKAWFAESAQTAAKEERKESLIDGAAAIERCAKEGIEVISWSNEAIEEFKNAVAPVYEQFADYFDNKDLVNKIKAA